MTQKKIELQDKDVEEVKLWLSRNTFIPDIIRTKILGLCDLFEVTKEREIKRKETLDRLKEAQGLKPISERGGQNQPSENAPTEQNKFKNRFHKNKLSKSQAEVHADKMFDDCKLSTELKSENIAVKREENFKNETGLRSDWYKRTIWDLKIVLTKKEVNVETVYDPLTDKRVTADVTYAPPGSNHTYDTIALLVHLHVAYLIPTERLSRMFSGEEKSFSSSLIWNFIHQLAICFLPVYFEMTRLLGEKITCFQVDDTTPRVLEIRNEKKPDIKENNILIKSLKEYFNYNSTRKNLNLSVISGKINPADEKTRIILFRSHHGAVGQLLENIIKKHSQNSERKIQVIQDMSTQSTPKLPDVEVVGCAAHARRPFWRYRDHDPEFTYYILRCFAALSDIERNFSSKNQSESLNKLFQYRKKYALKIWNLIVKKCHKLSLRWPPATELGKACKYIDKNFVELTRYLYDPMLPWTNNLSERLLRPEKLMLANSKFRTTLEGRAAIDILTSIMATARLAGISWQEYAVSVMKSQQKVSLNPERWLPHIFANNHSN